MRLDGVTVGEDAICIGFSPEDYRALIAGLLPDEAPAQKLVAHA